MLGGRIHCDKCYEVHVIECSATPEYLIVALRCCLSFCSPTMWISCEYPHIASLLSLPFPFPVPVLQVITEASSLCCVAASHQLSSLHTVVCICQSQFPCFIPHPPRLPVYVRISVFALEIGSSVPFF